MWKKFGSCDCHTSSNILKTNHQLEIGLRLIETKISGRSVMDFARSPDDEISLRFLAKSTTRKLRLDFTLVVYFDHSIG